MFLLNLTTTLFLSMTANASTVESIAWTPSTQKVANADAVTLSSTAQLSIDGQSVQVNQIGAGLRAKRVFGMVNVYVGELFASAPEKFVREESQALRSLLQSETVAMKLTFVRGVDAFRMKTAFTDGLDANADRLKRLGLSVDQTPLVEWLTSVGDTAEMLNTNTLVLIVHRDTTATTTLTYQDPKGAMHSFSGNAELMEAVFSIWLGDIDSEDVGLVALKTALVKGL